MWIARTARRERKRWPCHAYLALSSVASRTRENEGTRGSDLELQPTWIREMGNADQIGARWTDN